MEPNFLAARQLGMHTGSREFVSDPRRKSPRRKVSMPAEISVGDRSRRVTCQITDMSATGARVRLMPQPGQSTIDGNRIALYFDKPRMSVECLIVWFADNQFGVQFRSAFSRCGQQPLPVAMGH